MQNQVSQKCVKFGRNELKKKFDSNFVDKNKIVSTLIYILSNKYWQITTDTEQDKVSYLSIEKAVQNGHHKPLQRIQVISINKHPVISYLIYISLEIIFTMYTRK